MKKKKISSFKFFSLFFAMIVLVLVVGCSGTTPTTPIINSFLANPTSITVGESSNLSWSVTDATTVTIDQSVGSVTSTGTTAVTPATTTTYTLTATNTAGSVTAMTTVTVNVAVMTYGSIDIQSTPTGAKVYLDGVNTGSITPYIMTHVDTGIHTIKLDKYHYKIQEDVNVSVNSEETTYLNWSLTYAPTQTITLQPGTEGKDDYTSTTMPDSNFATYTNLYVGTYSTSDYYRGYLQFDLSTVPADARLEDADLRLYQHDSEGSGNFQIGLHRVTSNWQENTITHNLQPNSSSTAEALLTVYTGSTTWRNWDIDNLVQGWLDGSITNQGMVLKSTDETLTAIGIYFRSSDYTMDTTKCPKLEIDYYLP